MGRFAVITIFISVIVVACNTTSEKNQMLFWSSNNSQEITYSKKLIDDWNQNHPDKQIKSQPIPEGQSSEEIILASVVGKTTPDIYANMWQGSVEMYANAGVLIPFDTLNGFMDFIKSRCPEDVIDEITSNDGHIYQVPWKANPIITLYNKVLFKENGIDSVPVTYSQYLEAGKKIQLDKDRDGYVDRWIGYTSVKVIWYQRLFNFYPLYLAATNGAPLIRDNKAAFNNQYAIDIFYFLQELYNNNYFSRQQMSSSQDPFVMETVATLFTGPWQVPYLNKFKPEDLEYGFYSMLVPDDHEGPIYTYGDPKNIVIFNTCKNPENAWKFLKTMIDQKGDLQFLKLTNQLPRRKALTENKFFEDYFNKNPKLKIFADQAKYVKGTDASPALKEVFDLISQQYEACVVYGTKTPKQALQDAADAVNLLFLE